jgi:hypothetical protein
VGVAARNLIFLKLSERIKLPEMMKNLPQIAENITLPAENN